mmetsp:Transcript_20561/g.49070  ORF Transcript_20561/g.49070 Transcript_20561/m.49070 type:complete len:200 (-) Transcript_20561:270-869(-)
MAAASGVKRTRVGYCGGTTPNPTYRKVCSDKAFGDWAEAVQVDFDPSIISYEALVGVFFKSHEPGMCGGKRQYMSGIFAHTAEQFEAAQKVLEAEKDKRKGRLGTSLEMATDFYSAELYHQKWLLQRKSDWFKAVALQDGEHLLDSEAACKVNAFVAGHLPASTLRDELDRMAQSEQLDKGVWSSLRTKLRLEGCEGDD